MYSLFLCYSLYCLTLGGLDYWTIQGTLCVCVKFFVYGSVCGLCARVFVCLRETVPYVESGCGFGPRPYL